MKKIFFSIFILFLFFSCCGQSYLGWVTRQTSLRDGAGKGEKITKTLKAGSQIFIISQETDNDYYNIIDIRSNKEGFIHKSFVKIGKEIRKNEKGIFTPSGEITADETEVEIYNNTIHPLTLKLNSETYNFSPHEKRTITILPGSYDYRASAPGVIPNIGTDQLEAKMSYTWQFYIRTKIIKHF